MSRRRRSTTRGTIRTPTRARRHQAFADFMIPIVKGWSTEMAQEVTSLGMQVHGGMGFIEETGAAQHFRDARIITIYEGTTGIQANDLIGRKTARDARRGREERWPARSTRSRRNSRRAPSRRCKRSACSSRRRPPICSRRSTGWYPPMASSRAPRTRARWRTSSCGDLAAGGWQMGRAALVAADQLAAGEGDSQFLHAKIATARYYADCAAAAGIGSRAHDRPRRRERARAARRRVLTREPAPRRNAYARSGCRKEIIRRELSSPCGHSHRLSVVSSWPPRRFGLVQVCKRERGASASARRPAMRSAAAISSRTSRAFRRVSRRKPIGRVAEAERQRFVTDLLVDPVRVARIPTVVARQLGAVRVVRRSHDAVRRPRLLSDRSVEHARDVRACPRATRSRTCSAAARRRSSRRAAAGCRCCCSRTAWRAARSRATTSSRSSRFASYGYVTVAPVPWRPALRRHRSR